MFQEIEAFPFSSLIFVPLLLADNALWYSFLQMYTFMDCVFFRIWYLSLHLHEQRFQRKENECNNNQFEMNQI